MAQTVSEGCVYNYTASGAVVNGNVFVKNRMVGVALTSGVTGDAVAIATKGVFTIASVATGAKSAGSLVYYRATGGLNKAAMTATGSVGATGATGSRTAWVIGTVWETATAAVTILKVRLVGGPMRKL